ncbi:MAG: hypothetical protein F2536_03155 [Actinobacteria bacterium]|uniref:Unannotated protein n=1 Tax=freshwater metagenome TaxID=449393 RepID=A0A6J6C3C9_9ZZZZ|nr:hypothetical protein [Actinomycetota bacterium]
MSFVFWIVSAVVIGVVSSLYHPSTELVVGGLVIGLALNFLITWSSSKLTGTKWWIARVALISIVAGLMNSTALDVLYSIFAAPAGGRFEMGIETVLGGVVLTALAYLNSLLGPQKKENPGSQNSKR